MIVIIGTDYSIKQKQQLQNNFHGCGSSRSLRPAVMSPQPKEFLKTAQTVEVKVVFQISK